jgi:hypothetical protein
MSQEPPTPMPPQIEDLYKRFVAFLAAGDTREAQKLAPGVLIETQGWPYPAETGPLNTQAFKGDPGIQRLLSWQQTGPERYLLRSGIAYFTVEMRQGHFAITDAGLKPID